MASHIRDRIAPVTWELLLTTLYSLRAGPPIEDGRDHEILIASPWISDIENRQHRLSLPIREIVAGEMGRDFRHLAHLLISLSDAGASIGLMTASMESSWKSDKSETYKSRERNLLRMLHIGGVTVRVHDSNHSKFVSCPLGVLSGSANVTDNGFYHNTEMMTLSIRGEGEFDQARAICSDIWFEGHPFIST